LERSSLLLAPLRHEPRKGLPPRGVVDSLVESVKPGKWESGDLPKESGWELWEFSEPLKMKGIQFLVMDPVNALLKEVMTHLLSSSKSRVLIMVREVGPAWVLSLIKRISRKLEVQLIVSRVATDPDDATIERMNAAAMEGVKFKVFPARAASAPCIHPIRGLCDVHGGLIIADGEVVLSGAFSLERCSFHQDCTTAVLTRAQSVVARSTEFFDEYWKASELLDCWGRTPDMRKASDAARRARAGLTSGAASQAGSYPEQGWSVEAIASAATEASEAALAYDEEQSASSASGNWSIRPFESSDTSEQRREEVLRDYRQSEDQCIG
jgi:hypothetical protein